MVYHILRLQANRLLINCGIFMDDLKLIGEQSKIIFPLDKNKNCSSVFSEVHICENSTLQSNCSQSNGDMLQ